MFCGCGYNVISKNDFLIEINRYDIHVQNEYYRPLLNHIIELERRNDELLKRIEQLERKCN